MFDIQNIFNKEIDKIYRTHIFENSNLFGMLYKSIKNSIKFILQRGTQDWPFIVSQTPSDPLKIYDLLTKQLDVESKNINIYAWSNDMLINLGEDNKKYEEYSRLIFVVNK